MNCPHTGPLDAPGWVEPAPSSSAGCEGCLAIGAETWAHLRLCLGCGHVGCCDSTPYRHAREHAQASDHPVMRSFEPGESWRWCYLDDRVV